MNGMKYIRLIFWAIIPLLGYAQPDGSFAQLKKDFPSLMDKFSDKLQAQKANYIFAIDVSGTMNQYEHIVVPAMSQFIESLSEGDNINVIRFGTTAQVSMGGLSDIDKSSKADLRTYIRTLYQRDPELFAYTDLKILLERIDKEMRFQKNNLTFLFVLTDFINDPAKGNSPLTDRVCATIKESLDARAVDHLVYMYALQLPVKGSNHLSAFREAIPESFHFEPFSITSPTALKSWFDRKKEEILLDKFRAIVNDKNKLPDTGMSAEVDVDGNISMRIDWDANRLYDVVSVDTLVLSEDSAGFNLCLPDRYPYRLVETGTIEGMGRIKHTAWGFHPFRGQIIASLSLPTGFDNELRKLGIKKPGTTLVADVDRNLFTGCLPFRWVLAIVLLILAYGFAVLRAYRRNYSDARKINGRFEVSYRGRSMARQEVYGVRELGVGCDGKPFTVTGNGCDWQLRFFQECYNPWIFFYKKPRMKLMLEKGKGMRTSSGSFMCGDITSVSKGEAISLRDFTVSWNDL